MLPEANISDKICITDLDEILLNSISNIWSNQEYVQVFDSESIHFKGAITMFDIMEISEYIYDVVVESPF